MSKWEQATVVEDRPKWLDAPEVEPAQGEPLADIEARQMETLKAYPGLYDAPDPVYRPEPDIGLAVKQYADRGIADNDLIGMAVHAHAIAQAGGPEFDELFKQEVSRRQYAGFFDELGRSFGKFKLEAGSAILNATAKIMQAGQNAPGAWYPRGMFPEVEEKTRQDTQLLSEAAQSLWDEAQEFKYQPGVGGGVRGFTAQVLGNVVPYAGLAMAGGLVAGPVGAFGAAATIEGNQGYREALADGQSEEVAMVNGTVRGAAVGLLEVLQLSKLVKFGRGAASAVRKEFGKEIAESAMKRIAKTTAVVGKRQVTTALDESFVEVLQEWAGDGTAFLVYGKEPADFLRRTGLAAAGGFVGALALGPAFIVVNGQQPKAVEQRPENAKPYETEPERPVVQSMDEYAEKVRAGEEPLPPMVMSEDEYATYEDIEAERAEAEAAPGEGAGASAVASGVPAPATETVPVAAGTEEAVTPTGKDSLPVQKQPTFVTDGEGNLARVVRWTDDGKPIVVYPGKSGGVQPGTARQGVAGRSYEYILDEATPATADDFSQQVRPGGSQKQIDLRMWRDEFAQQVREESASARQAVMEDAAKGRRREILRNRVEQGEDIQGMARNLVEFKDEPWAQEALAKLGPQGQVTAQGEAAATPPAAPALPEELKSLAENAKGMTRERFLAAYQAGLNEQNLSKRETAQKIDAYMRLTLKIGPEQFYDTYVVTQQPPGAKEGVQPPAPGEIRQPAASDTTVGQTGAALTKAIQAKNFDVLKEALLPGNDAARAQFEDETGIELPESTAGTENTVGEFVAGRLSPPTEPRLPGGAQAGGTTLLPDMAAEIASIAKTVVNNPIRLVTAVWESLKRNMVAATTYMRTLGPAGVKTAGELDDITKDVVTKSNTDQADLRLVHKGVSKSNRERLYQAMNERIPLSELPQWLRERVDAARKVLDRSRSVAQKLGMQVTMPSGEKVDIDFTGKAYPQIPNAEGLRFLEEAYTQGKGSSRVFAWAQEQVKAKKYADVDEAIQALVRFRDSRFRGVNGYLERTRVELPIEMVEWDGAKTLSTVLERNWMTVEGVRRWGNDFERLEGRIEKMREDHGADAAQRVRSYIRTSFGIQSPASRSSQAISNVIRGFQFTTKIAMSPLTIGRNMADRIAKGMMASPLGTIQASVEYPPFVNAVLPHAQRLEDQMIRNGVVFGHGSLSEGYEAGSFFADLAKSPFASSERGNQVFIGLVHYKKLMHDIAILEREHAGSMGRVENAIRTVFGQSAAQATERVGPKIAAKLAAGEEIEQKDIYRFLHEMVRDRAFPMVLSTKPIWYDAHPMMKVLAQFKTWPMRQTNMIWEDVVKYTVKTGDLTRLIGFVVGTLIAGELYNIARDLLYGRRESVALSDDTAKAVLKDLADGGLWGIAADLTYGITDWAGGVSFKTAKNVGVASHNIWKNWTLAPEAVEKFLSQEMSPYRQVKELARRLDNGDLSESYGQWRARVYEWKDTKKAPTAFARMTSYAEDIVFGKPEYEIGPNTLALDLASRHVVAGDIEGAAKYIAIALKNADNPKEALGGIKSSRTRRSPMGGIPQKDWREFLKSLNPEQRTAVQRVQREYMTAYDRAIGMAMKNVQ